MADNQAVAAAAVAAAPAASAAASMGTAAANAMTSAGQSVLGALQHAGDGTRMVAGQLVKPVDNFLKKMHFSEYKSGCIAEFLGSFLITLTVSLAQAGTGTEKRMMPIAVGFMYASLIFTFNYISGGHFNPAVTLGVWLSRDGPASLVWHKVVLYWVFQLLGATIAAFYSMFAYGSDFAVPTTPDTFYPGIFRVLITEAVYTFVVVSVMLHVAVSAQKENSFHGFAVGMAYLCAMLANNGGVLNPATATSLIVVKCFTGTCVPVLHLWVFWTGELIGCIFAAVFYNIASTTLEEQEKERLAIEAAKQQIQAAALQQASLHFGDAPQEDMRGHVALRESEAGARTPRPSAAPMGAAPAGAVLQQQQPQMQQMPPPAAVGNPYVNNYVRPVAPPQAQFTPNVEMTKAPTAAPSPAPLQQNTFNVQSPGNSAPQFVSNKPNSLGEDVSPLYN